MLYFLFSQSLQCLPIVSVELSLVGNQSEQKIPIIGLDMTLEEAHQQALYVYSDTDYALSVNLHYENTPAFMVNSSIFQKLTPLSTQPPSC